MTPIAEALFSDLARRLGSAPVPRVKALHLPPVPWNGSKDGEFGALELEDGSLGLSYVLPVSYTHLDVYKRQVWNH